MDVPCAAMRDRHDPEMMRCVGCRIYWEVSYPNPPRCPVARQSARPSATSELVRGGPTKPLTPSLTGAIKLTNL
jgi:hypothetical protein